MSFYSSENPPVLGTWNCHRGDSGSKWNIPCVRHFSNLSSREVKALQGEDAASPGGHLLQGGSAQLDSDVLELPVPLRAEVADHVRVLIGLAQQLHLPVCEAEALGKNPLHRDITVIKGAPAAREGKHNSPLHSEARPRTENIDNRSHCRGQ